MWRTGASLELLPLQTKTQLGDALIALVKKGEMVDTGLWCLSRLGARKLFYGPINQVLPAQTATRWVEALLKVPKSEDAVVAIARRTGDSTRDLSPATIEMIRKRIPEALVPALEGEVEEDLGKVFGEELPSGLVVAVRELVTEDSIIAKLRRRAPLIGDDCAVIPSPGGEDLLLKADLSIEGVHFTREIERPEEIGARAVARSLSDIAAMGGTPLYCLISMALAPWTDAPLDRRASIAASFNYCAKRKPQLAGGDISHADQFVCDVMLCGSVAKGKALLRSGARPGDALYVSGPLGGWRHKPADHAAAGFRPQTAWHGDRLHGHQRRPRARSASSMQSLGRRGGAGYRAAAQRRHDRSGAARWRRLRTAVYRARAGEERRAFGSAAS